MKQAFIILLSLIVFGCVDKPNKTAAVMNTQTQSEKTWSQQLDEILPLLGHRNWILVVDKAFPLQSANGMTYIDTQSDLLQVLDTVVRKVNKSTHVKGIFYTDTELGFLTEELVPGIGTFRDQLQQSLKGNNIQTLNHNDVFEKLDSASKLFNVVILKTENVMPYTSVFVELDCGYWSAEKENQLRASIAR